MKHQFTPPPVQVFKIQDEDLLVRIGDGAWTLMGWEYQAVGNYVQQHCYKYEIQHPGSCKKVIPAFRAGCAKASTLPPETIIRLHRCGLDASLAPTWQCDELAAKLGLQWLPSATEQLEFPLSDVFANNAWQQLTLVAPGQIEWILPGPQLIEDPNRFLFPQSRNGISSPQPLQASLF